MLALVAAVLLALVFVLVERTTTAPMVPFSYFSSATHRAAVGAMLLMGAVMKYRGGEDICKRKRPLAQWRSCS